MCKKCTVVYFKNPKHHSLFAFFTSQLCHIIGKQWLLTVHLIGNAMIMGAHTLHIDKLTSTYLGRADSGMHASGTSGSGALTKKQVIRTCTCTLDLQWTFFNHTGLNSQWAAIETLIQAATHCIFATLTCRKRPYTVCFLDANFLLWGICMEKYRPRCGQYNRLSHFNEVWQSRQRAIFFSVRTTQAQSMSTS